MLQPIIYLFVSLFHSRIKEVPCGQRVCLFSSLIPNSDIVPWPLWALEKEFITFMDE